MNLQEMVVPWDDQGDRGGCFGFEVGPGAGAKHLRSRQAGSLIKRRRAVALQDDE